MHVTKNAGLSALLGPASVSIHDDRNMAGNATGIQPLYLTYFELLRVHWISDQHVVGFLLIRKLMEAETNP